MTGIPRLKISRMISSTRACNILPHEIRFGYLLSRYERARFGDLLSAFLLCEYSEHANVALGILSWFHFLV